MARCDCPRGRALLEAERSKEPREPRPPVISTEFALVAAEMMDGMDFFPAGAGARGMIADEIAAMCASEDEALWLVKRMVRLYRKWPSLVELRFVYCEKHHPLDCIQPTIEASEIHPLGLPPEGPPPLEPKMIAPGPEQVAIEETLRDIHQTVGGLVELKDLNRMQPLRAGIVELPVIQITDANRITPEQVEEAARLYREAKAKQELELTGPDFDPDQAAARDAEEAEAEHAQNERNSDVGKSTDAEGSGSSEGL